MIIQQTVTYIYIYFYSAVLFIQESLINIPRL